MGAPEGYGFIGGGNMAEALIKGLLESGLAKAEEISVFDPDQARRDLLSEKFGVNFLNNNKFLVKKSRVVVLAVKPQVMSKVLSEIQDEVGPENIIISIAAGVTLTQIQGGLSASVPVIRVMPNTPALVLAGAAAMAPGSFCGPEHMETAREILEAVGVAVEVEEKYLDVVTGLSGSGPAYVFHMIESLTEAAVRLGLARPQAKLLAEQTVFGAAKLAKESELHPAQLRDMVTSPGGTTAAGLHALEKGAFRGLIMDAVAASAGRSKELGKK